MKATDLMLGDWVMYFGVPSTILEITRDYILIDEGGPEETMASINDLDPIPLTPEILEKNGWMWDESWDAFVNRGSPIQFEIGKDGNRFWWVEHNGLIAPINAVHEFQHALRLCGIEKEIII